MKKLVPIIIVIVLVGGVAAILATRHKSDTTPTPVTQSSSTSNSTATQPVSTNSVSIKDFMFSPDSITVKKGATVTWTNQDGTSHTVTADKDGGPDSGTLADGKSYSFTFDTVGTFTYHCEFHSDMKGTVIVTE